MRLRWSLIIPVGAMLVMAGCSGSPEAHRATSTSTSSSSTTVAPTTVPIPSGGRGGSSPTTLPSSVWYQAQPNVAMASTALAGKVIGIDPGHNGNNWAHPEIINALVPDGVGQKACDTTGTASYGGYSEAAFTWAVSQYLAADLAAEGAKVAMTRGSNDGVGPCVDQRAAMVNQAGAAVAVSIHADGGPDSGRGFAVLEPSGAGPSGAIVGSSAQLGQDIAAAIQAAGMPPSSYDGVNGIAQRSDLAGLNLATQPKVMVEVGNMRNSVDAAMLADPGFQQAVAKAVAQAITNFIGG